MDVTRFVLDPAVMRHGHHTRRSAPDPLETIDAATWLTVRDMCSQLLDHTELPRLADQRNALVGGARGENRCRLDG